MLRASPPATRRPVTEDSAETAVTGAGITAGAAAGTRAMADADKPDELDESDTKR